MSVLIRHPISRDASSVVKKVQETLHRNAVKGVGNRALISGSASDARSESLPEG